MQTSMDWDIFCRVIDNHGDLGVTWRLSAELAARGQQVRLWVDDPSALAWMAPQGAGGVEVIPWTDDARAAVVPPGDAVVEAFGCDPPPAFVQAMAERARPRGVQPAWINLEYLSAEAYVERCHGLPSPVMSGPGRGLVKQFFYPGFTPRTGGLLRERDLADRLARFDRTAWCARLAPALRADAPLDGATLAGERLVSLFCYEPAALPALLQQVAADPRPTRLLVTPGRAEAAVRLALGALPEGVARRVAFLPYLTQPGYDELLWACELNLVRGEDSLVRALWAGRPFLWHIYPQDDGAHRAKLDAFLDWLQAPADWRQAQLAWNGFGGPLPLLRPGAWQPAASAATARLLAQDDLASQLLRSVMP